MTDIQARVRASLRARLVAAGASEFADAALFDEVDTLFRQALSHDDRGALILPPLLPDDWQPALSLRLASHRGGLGAVLVFIKRRLLLPLTRWLFEYALENFRRQQRTNLALMACLQTLAVEHVRLRRELADASARSESRGPASTGPTSTGPTSAGPTSAGPTSTGLTSAGPTSAGPTSAGPTSAGRTSPEAASLGAASPDVASRAADTRAAEGRGADSGGLDARGPGADAPS